MKQAIDYIDLILRWHCKLQDSSTPNIHVERSTRMARGTAASQAIDFYWDAYLDTAGGSNRFKNVRFPDIDSRVQPLSQPPRLRERVAGFAGREPTSARELDELRQFVASTLSGRTSRAPVGQLLADSVEKLDWSLSAPKT